MRISFNIHFSLPLFFLFCKNLGDNYDKVHSGNQVIAQPLPTKY